MNVFPLISVIVTTKNEEKNIENCLKSVRNQAYPQDKIEIIVVDNNSTDRTKEIVLRYTDKVYNWGPERSAQRNFGVKQANGEYILYLDADMILSENIISECVKKCQKEGYIALYIPERIVNLPVNEFIDNFLNRCNQFYNLRNQPFWIKVRDFERSFYNGTCIDAVRFVRRDKFLEIGGFDENLTGPEDWDFDRRIREIGEVGIIESPIYHNEGEFSLRKYISKKAYYSQNFNKYIQKWSHIDSSVPVDNFTSTGRASNGIKAKTDPVIKKQLGFWYRYLGVFVENGKWRKLLRHPVLTLGMYTLRFLVGFNYLLNKNKDLWEKY